VESAAVILLRGPLLSAFVLGWAISMLISSTLVPRLLIDGAISFLFVPVFQLIGFAVVYRRAPLRAAFADAVDRFFATNTPWLLWLFRLGLWCVLQSPREAALWSWNEIRVALAAVIPVIAWSWWLERDLLRTRESLAFRAIVWPAVLIYFVGIAVWSDVRWFFAA
jgi:hypothetical protein